MSGHLITFICQDCGTKVHAYIDKKGDLKFSIREKLIGREELLNEQGYYICIDCKRKSTLRFSKVFP